MATGLISAAADDLLDSLAAAHTWVQLHTADPGAAGTTAVAANTTRKQVTWAPASGGALTSAAALEWTNVPGAEDYTHFSVWSASSGGTCGFTGAVTANAVATGDTFTIPTGDLDASFAVAS